MTKQNLLHLEFEPTKKTLLFHYCDENAFRSICSNNIMWMSSIFTMNDSAELSWGRNLLVEVLRDNKELFSQEFRIFTVMTVFSPDNNLLPLIVCFSRNGDLLSQWRAYANDGQGFSIGFDGYKMSNELGIRMKKVLYQKEDQKRMILNSLKQLFSFWKRNGEKPTDDVWFNLMHFAIDLISIKNPSFFEEREIRAIRLLIKDNGNWIDSGGHNHKGKELSKYLVEVRNRGTEKIPYIKMPFLVNDESIIKKVILGPKNHKSVNEIADELKNYGLKNIEVTKSESSYR